MLDQIIAASGNIIPHLLDAGVTDLIIYGIGFIGFCILGSLLTRKDRKENPGKYSYGSATIDGQDYFVTRTGNYTNYTK